MKRKMQKILFLFLIMFTLPFIISLITVFIYSFGSKLINVDAAVVFGAAAYSEDNPSYTLLVRTVKAAELYKKGLVKFVIVSGDNIEPDEMKKILLDRGVDSKKIILDKLGTNTLLTVKNAKKILSEKGLSGAIMVSSDYHLARICLFIKREGIEYFGTPAKSRFFPKIIYYYFREVIALMYYFIFKS